MLLCYFDVSRHFTQRMRVKIWNIAESHLFRFIDCDRLDQAPVIVLDVADVRAHRPARPLRVEQTGDLISPVVRLPSVLTLSPGAI
jgi:hypothetical protein